MLSCVVRENQKKVSEFQISKDVDNAFRRPSNLSKLKEDSGSVSFIIGGIALYLLVCVIDALNSI